MYCKHCGSQIDDDSVFCSKCGKTQGGRGKTAREERGNGAKQGSSSSILKVIYGAIAFLCIVPVPIAEYRRIVLGVFGVQYWLTCAPVLISCFCLYKLLSSDALKAERERVDAAKRSGQDYEDGSQKIKTNALTLCCVIVAVVAFASGGLMHLLF